MQELERLNHAWQEVYALVVAAEMPLVCAARDYLGAHREALACDSAYALLLNDPIPTGQWERAVALAARLGRV